MPAGKRLKSTRIFSWGDLQGRSHHPLGDGSVDLKNTGKGKEQEEDITNIMN